MGREEKRDLKVMRSSSEVSSWLEFLSFFWGGMGWGGGSFVFSQRANPWILGYLQGQKTPIHHDLDFVGFHV